jgi:ABC-type branched-subunit amino acid transport system ATPase component
MSEAPDMLTLRGVVAGYGYGDVLRGVDLTVERGSVTCIVGPNGAGKSTVLRAISGLLRPRQGEIAYEGDAIGGLPPAQVLARGISQVPQSNGVFPNLTVRENVLLGAYIARRERSLVARRLGAVAEVFPIVAERGEERAGNLSGGQRRTVEFARSLMLDPALVMLDEPSVGLDPKALRVVAAAIRQMSDAGKTLLMVEQNVRFGLRMATYGVVMESGSVLLEGRSDDVLANPEVSDLYFGGSARARGARAAAEA